MTPRLLLRLVLLGLSGVTTVSHATSQSTSQTPSDDSVGVFQSKLKTTWQLAEQQQLATSVAWRRLLYFSDTPSIQHLDQSRVINRFNSTQNQRQFFVSQYGDHDPKAELQATLSALFDPTMTGDKAVACRFPARTAWLKQRLALADEDLPAVDCPTLSEWRQKLDTTHLSIVFANEYLDNSASAFAHSFLLFGNGEQPNEFYLNYSPRVIAGESTAKFAYKSTISGNAGEFTLNPYAQNIQQYKVNEGRDIWRYPLKLTPTQANQLANQVFEIKNQVLPYYLFNQNCASEILVLLNTLFPNKDYLAHLTPTVAPAQIVRRLQQEDLLATAEFEPSQTTLQQAMLNEKKIPLVPQDKTANNVTINDTLSASRNNPQLANPLRFWTLGLQSLDTTGKTDEQGVQLGYRLVYHDALDKPLGYPIGSQLTGLSVDVLVNPTTQNGDKAVQLEQATLLEMRSLKPINSAKNHASWGIKVGLQQVFDKARLQQENDDSQHLVGNISLNYGKALGYGSPLAGSGELPPNICYGLGNVSTQVGKGLNKGFRVGIGADIGCIQQFGDRLRGLAEINLPYWIAGDGQYERYWQPKLTIGTQFDLNRQNAIRLLASRDWLGRDKKNNPYQADKLTVSYIHYFE